MLKEEEVVSSSGPFDKIIGQANVIQQVRTNEGHLEDCVVQKIPRYSY